MSKSILVIDTPGDCLDCPLSYTYGDWDIACAYHGQKVDREDSCPLKPLPERASKDKTKIYTIHLNPDENDGAEEGVWCVGGGINYDFDTGWNACLEVVLEGARDE